MASTPTSFERARSLLGYVTGQYVYGAQWHDPQSSRASSSLEQQDWRDVILTRLHGQVVIVPDLNYIYSEWKVGMHPDVDELREDLEEWFAIYVPTPTQRAKQRRVDNALCTGYFWPYVTKERFFHLGSLVAFFFFWDDEIDCGTLTNDRAKTEAYCDDSIAFIKHHLQPELNVSAPIPGRLHNSGAWVEIGRAMQKGQSKEARDRFAESIYGFIAAVRTSQALWLTGVSTFEDYTRRRMQTVGTSPLLTGMHWSYSLSLPSNIYDHEAAQALFREVTIGVFLFNDIISLKKEVVDGDVDSAIPILVMNEGITAQAAVDKCVKMTEDSWKKLLAAEQRLKVIAKTEHMKHDIEVLVGSCKDIVVGHMDYTLRASRYMSDATFEGKENSFRVVL